MTMENTINWFDDIRQATDWARGAGKPVLMFFHYRQCTGCINTINKTLPKMSVTDAINEGFVPVMLETTERPTEAAHYNIEWTPTFIVTDESGAEQYRWIGYLPEDDFLGHLNMALAKVAMNRRDFKDAERRLDEVVLKFPLTELAPQALYYLGIARYKATSDVKNLSHIYEELKDAYPESPWTIKASVWTDDEFNAMKKAA